MNLDDATRERIAGLIEANPVMLFMKGVRGAPQCGFSAQVCQMLDSLLPEYATHDVLSDPEVRDGIKAFSNWPTVPQLYVRGEFMGGCDIVRDLYASGELHEKLGVAAPAGAVTDVTVTVTEKAAAELQRVASERPGQLLHLQIDARFDHGLFFGPEQPGDLSVTSSGIELHLDPLTASRANGVVIDLAETDRGSGFHIENPNAPSPVQQLTAKELAAMRESGEPFLLLDVRTPQERETAQIEGSRLLDEATAREVEQMPKDTVLVFHCHHGGRSQKAAEHFAALGFTQVFNVVGGIDSWSQDVDPSVARY